MGEYFAKTETSATTEFHIALVESVQLFTLESSTHVLRPLEIDVTYSHKDHWDKILQVTAGENSQQYAW